MGTATRKVAAVFGAVLVAGGTSVALGQATAWAAPEPTPITTESPAPEAAPAESAAPSESPAPDAAPATPAESAPPSGSAPAAPAAAGNVRYTLTTAGPYEFQLTYLATQPPSKAAYNADAYAYLKRDTVTVTPDAPWVFDANLADPQWAYFAVSSTAKGGQAAPNAHCEIAVDGTTATQNDHPYSPRCQLSQW